MFTYLAAWGSATSSASAVWASGDCVVAHPPSPPASVLARRLRQPTEFNVSGAGRGLTPRLPVQGLGSGTRPYSSQNKTTKTQH